MAELDRAVAALRIVDDELVRHDVTSAPGCGPTKKFARREVLEYPKRPSRTARSGLWSLQGVETEPADLHAQIMALLDRAGKATRQLATAATKRRLKGLI